MRTGCPSARLVLQRAIPSLFLSAFIVWLLLPHRRHEPVLQLAELEQKYPLLWTHVHVNNGTGGAWYIPPHWLASANVKPVTIVDAALIASQAATANHHRLMSHSSIPLILHQTWKNRRIETWSDLLRDSVEKWLEYVVSDDMAYFFWDDDGLTRLLAEFEPDFVDRFHSLPTNVERSDVFRVVVLKWFGGIYADVDTQALRKPAAWVSPSDLAPWTDPVSEVCYTSNSSVNLVLGIEADCPPDGNEYWRMGYTYPVQLTQWALAASSGHPVLLRFLETLTIYLQAVADRYDGDLRSPDALRELRRIGPLSLTGPVAITVAAQSWLETQSGLRWNALTGLHDGGRSKLVEDVLILPITGFSPGRGRYGNMGSKPVSDPSARVWHRAQGSWRSFNIKVEYGKFCRTIFAMCRWWPKTEQD